MRLYDCDQNAQQDIIDSGIEPNQFNPPKANPAKQFDDFKI
jgi:hypothetical protein